MFGPRVRSFIIHFLISGYFTIASLLNLNDWGSAVGIQTEFPTPVEDDQPTCYNDDGNMSMIGTLYDGFFYFIDALLYQQKILTVIQSVIIIMSLLQLIFGTLVGRVAQLL